MNLYSIPTLLSFLYTLGLASLVFLQGRRHLVNKVFALAIFSVSIMEFGNFMALNSSHSFELLFWARISLVGCCFVPANWSLFSLVFGGDFKKITRNYKLILLIIYIFAFSFLIFTPYDLFITLPHPEFPNQNSVFLGMVGRFFSFFLLLAIIFILTNLETVYRNSRGSKKWQIKYTVIAMFAAFIFYIFVITRVILFRYMDLFYLPTGSAVILICSALLTYSLIRHRLMNVDIFISRQVFYGSFTIIVISGYLIVVGFIGELVKLFNLNFNLIFYPLFVLISLVALSAYCLSEKNKKIVKNFIDRHFYRNKFDYRFEWIELTKRISSVVNLNDLLTKFMDLIAETMCVSEIMVWLFDEDDRKFHLSGSRHPTASAMSIDKDNSLIKYLEDKTEPFCLNGKSSAGKVSDFCRENEKFLNNYGVSVISPLIAKDKLIAFITLGEEVTGAAYNYEDYDMLKTICLQAANAIMNIKLSERLVIAGEMDVMNKISSFVLHDLKNSISMLSLIVQNASRNMGNPEFQRDVLETISKSVENMKGLMAKISRLPREMELNKTKTNLTELLKKNIKNSGLGNAGIELTENYTHLPKVNLDQVQIQNVISNLVINAQESLKDKGKVCISSLLKDGEIVIEVKDNGPGISKEFINNKLFKPFQTTKKKGLGIGLYQCKIIMAAHGGNIEVESEEGKGTRFRIYLPIDD